MPELPEVETLRRQLEPQLAGRVLEALDIGDPRWCAPLPPGDVAATVQGRRLERLGRRGKYLVLAFGGEVFLVVHLRMTGTLLLDPTGEPPYARVTFGFEGGRRLVFCDPRRFGTGELAEGRGAMEAFFAARLGAEPLDDGFDAAYLRQVCRGSRAPIKALLLDQRRVAGVGNIYADEALFRAGIHPLRPARSLRRDQVEALRDGVVAALQAGLAAGGATIDDFRHADGLPGGFQDEFLVHRREGRPCVACGSTVVKMVAAGRGTYACERCQPRPRLRRDARARRRAASRPS